MATRKAFGTALLKLGRNNDRVVNVDGDVKNSTFSIDLEVCVAILLYEFSFNHSVRLKVDTHRVRLKVDTRINIFNLIVASLLPFIRLCGK